MLMPAIIGEQYQSAFNEVTEGVIPDLSFLTSDELVNVLQSIVNSNEKIGNLSKTELIVNQFLLRALQLVQHGENLLDMPDVAMSQWRTLYELTVCFRVWSQPVILTGKRELFFQLAKRFEDYGTLESVRVYNSPWTHVEREIELIYRKLPNHLQLSNEYDWLNPVFSESELKRRTNRFHNSFRDVVNRSKELNWDLWNLLDEYVKSSTILHFNPISLDLTKEHGLQEEVRQNFIICLQILLTDYLSLIISLYPKTEQTLPILNLAKVELKQVKRA